MPERFGNPWRRCFSRRLGDEGVDLSRGDWPLGAIAVRRLEQAAAAQRPEFAHHAGKGWILDFPLNLLAPLSLKFEDHLVAFHGHVVFQQRRRPTSHPIRAYSSWPGRNSARSMSRTTAAITFVRVTSDPANAAFTARLSFGRAEPKRSNRRSLASPG